MAGLATVLPFRHSGVAGALGTEAHELAHRDLTLRTNFGAFMLLLGHLRCPPAEATDGALRGLQTQAEEMLQLALAASWNVNEGFAVCSELHAATSPEEPLMRQLPDDYARALETFSAVTADIGNRDVAYYVQMALAVSAMTTTIDEVPFETWTSAGLRKHLKTGMNRPDDRLRMMVTTARDAFLVDRLELEMLAAATEIARAVPDLAGVTGAEIVRRRWTDPTVAWSPISQEIDDAMCGLVMAELRASAQVLQIPDPDGAVRRSFSYLEAGGDRLRAEGIECIQPRRATFSAEDVAYLEDVDYSPHVDWFQRDHVVADPRVAEAAAVMAESLSSPVGIWVTHDHVVVTPSVDLNGSPGEVFDFSPPGTMWGRDRLVFPATEANLVDVAEQFVGQTFSVAFSLHWLTPDGELAPPAERARTALGVPAVVQANGTGNALALAVLTFLRKRRAEWLTVLYRQPEIVNYLTAPLSQDLLLMFKATGSFLLKLALLDPQMNEWLEGVVVDQRGSPAQQIAASRALAAALLDSIGGYLRPEEARLLRNGR